MNESMASQDQKGNPSESRQMHQTDDHSPSTRPALSNSETGVADFLAFRSFATPVLVQIAFWIGTLTCLALGANMIDQATNRWGTNQAMFWTGWLTIILGPLALRIVGELILVVFRIHDQLEQNNQRA